jgi:hypothetical protein
MSRRRWEDNIRMDPKEIGISTRNWVDLAQDRDFWRALMNVPLYIHKLVSWSYVVIIKGK